MSTAFRVDATAVLDGISAPDHPAAWLNVLLVNAGMLLVWATVIPQLESVTSALMLAAYALIAIPWLRFAVDIAPVVSGFADEGDVLTS